MCQIQQKFPLGQGHRKMRIISSSVSNSASRLSRKVERLQWRSSYRLGCMCLHLSSVFWQWFPGLAVNCAVTAERARLWTSPESSSGPGNWWLLSVSNYSISKYLNRAIVWGELRVCFLPAPGWTSFDLPTATLKFAQCWKEDCFQQWPSGK